MRGARTAALPGTVEETSQHDLLGNDEWWAHVGRCRRRWVAKMKRDDFNFDAEREFCENGQMASQNRRFRKEYAQKDLDLIQQRTDFDCTRDREFGKEREERDVDKMHVCDADMFSWRMNNWRNQWLLKDGRFSPWNEVVLKG